MKSKYFILFFVVVFFGRCDDPTPSPTNEFSDVDESIQQLMAIYDIPGLSISITYQGRLVYEGSYGYADKEQKQSVTPSSLFRIASVSKPITAIAILKLVQDKKLQLDSFVFGAEGILKDDYGVVPAGSNKDKITIRHLLDHKSGWANDPNDPMFSYADLNAQQVIRAMLEGRPLSYVPGVMYYYSNLGYTILGKVIERVTGMAYEKFVQSEILSQAGIEQMKIGGNTLMERLPHEVKYYQRERDPYGSKISRMDAAAGWVASSTELLRFMMLIDGNDTTPDVIDGNLLQEFYFGNSNWLHYGSLAGTNSVLTRLNSEITFSILINRRLEGSIIQLAEDSNLQIGEILKHKTNWPDVDLF